MVKHLNLNGNSTTRLSARPSIHLSIPPSGAEKALVPKHLGAESSGGINKYGAETSWCETSRAESSRCRNDLVPKRL